MRDLTIPAIVRIGKRDEPVMLDLRFENGVMNMDSGEVGGSVLIVDHPTMRRIVRAWGKSNGLI